MASACGACRPPSAQLLADNLAAFSPAYERPALADRHAWIEEGAFAVAPGVHRIPLPLPMDGLRAVNVYAVEAAEGLVLIDSGWALASSRDQLDRSLARIGADLRDVRQFLVTHLHRDHYTQAVAIRRELGTHVTLGAEEKHSLDKLLGPDMRALNAQLRQLELAGAEPVARALAAVIDGAPGMTQADFGYDWPDEWITSGHVFDLGTRTLEAVATPGHTRGHLVFADSRAGLLFAGDHVLPQITPSIGFEESPAPLPLGQYLESLNVVRRMPDMTLLPAHGPVSPSTHARIDELISHHDGRLAAMRDLLAGGGALTAYQVAGELPWTSRKRRLADMDVMNQMLAICETAYHLDLLVARADATSSVADGIKRYELAAPPA
jgi:glyoxylase-like metal-dependent hydrolase (beta-lactamase superfamily II)